MSLRINQNLSALSAHRYMAANDASMSKSIQRLSSGLRINTAADDAAGLAISEQLRTQISGLTQATQNTTDADNMFKTADSALNEVETQLRDIRDLTLNASTATATSDMKSADQAQVAQAMSSIDRIADQTTFAGKQLLAASGSNLNGMVFQIGANNGETATFSVGGGNNADMHAGTVNGLNLNTGTNAYASYSHAYSAETAATNTQTLAISYTRADGTVDAYNVTLANADGSGDTLAHAVASLNTAFLAGRPAGEGAPKLVATANAGNIDINLAAGTSADEYSAAAKISVTQTAITNANGFTGLTTNVASTASGTSGAIDLTTSTTGVLAKIDAALAKVNTLRVNLGAFQKNTLESALSSLAVANENTTASESSIRDTDMAGEMVNFTRSQILTQAAQAMLTQANQAPQSILTMLR